MKKIKIYIYPIKANKILYNPYVIYLGKSLSIDNEISNCNGRNYGIFDLFKYIKCDVFIFNWTENLPKLKFGFLQSLNYILFTLIIKAFKSKQIIWILHNKQVHNNKSLLSGFIMNFNSRISNVVITHAHDGLTYYNDKFKKKNIIYTPHPVYENVKPIFNIPIIYDFILWGNIEPYKNIAKFLKFIKNKKYYSDKKILICGNCSNKNYLNIINSLITPNITFINGYIEENMLTKMISESKVILFCHSSDSILSSGALVYSLSYFKPIIAPNIGSFKDYEQMNLINTYNDFSEIEEIASNFILNLDKISNHLFLNTWSYFSNFLMKIILKNKI